MPAPVNAERANELLPRYYSKPGQLREEYAVDSVLRLATVPGEIISQQGTEFPMVANPPRYGYRRDPLTIVDVMATDRWAPTRRSWVSGAPALGNPRADDRVGAEGSPRNALTGLNYSA
jgi:hypothetical protein